MSRAGWVIVLFSVALACGRSKDHASPASVGSAVARTRTPLAPTATPGLPTRTAAPASPTVALSARYGSTCAVGADGRVRCWGNRLAPHAGDEAIQKRPFLVELGGRARRVALGDTLACAVLENGSVVCWAPDNDFERLITVDPVDGPVALSVLPPAIDVAVGLFHACAVAGDGTVRCWGSQRSGELGVEATHHCDGQRTWTCTRDVKQVEGLASASKLALGRGFSCALLKEGTVSCWGSNELGQLGTGGADKHAHIRPATVRSLGDVVDIAAGTDHICALTRDRAVHCWGRNDRHQLGSATQEHCVQFRERVACSTHPVRVPGTSAASSLAISNDTSCIIERDGEVACWGDRTDRLGVPTDATCPALLIGSESPCTTSPHALTGVPPLSALANGADHLCGLTTTGETWCWGLYYEGQLGFEPKECGAVTEGTAKPCLHEVREDTVSTPGIVDLAKAAAPSGDRAQTICESVRHVELPPRDRPTAGEVMTSIDCRSVNLYFGIGAPADPIAARKCAYREMEAIERPENPILSGAGLLSMVYANGRGVPRNIDVAVKLACSEGLGYCAQTLSDLKTAPRPAADFTVCDCVGNTHGFCAGPAEQHEAQTRAAKRAELSAQWAPNQKAALARLEHAAKFFFEARERNEVDLTGTARADMQLEERASLENGFMAALERFETGEIPPSSERPSLEARNAERRTFAAAQKSLPCGTIRSAGVRRTEEAWQGYVAAWAAFASLEYPTVPVELFKGWLADERRRMLEPLVGCRGQ